MRFLIFLLRTGYSFYVTGEISKAKFLTIALIAADQKLLAFGTVLVPNPSLGLGTQRHQAGRMPLYQ